MNTALVFTSIAIVVGFSLFAPTETSTTCYYKRYDTIKHVNITSYSNDVKQTDNTPNLTSSGIIIKDSMLNESYCAVSRDLLFHYFNFGDTIYYNKKKLIVIDVMNERFVNSVDILTKRLIKDKNFITFKKK